MVQQFKSEVGDVKDKTVIGRDLSQFILRQRGTPKFCKSDVLRSARVPLVLALLQVFRRKLGKHVFELGIKLFGQQVLGRCGFPFKHLVNE